MKRKDLFTKLLNDLKNSSLDDMYKYVGTGDPFADILIIGKEAAISKEKQPEQFKTEIIDNFSAWWKINEKGKFDQSKIQTQTHITYQTPLYPYKGQLLKINKGNNNGTSKTWFTYQKLYNRIFDNRENQNIDFHEGVFITEVNPNPSPKTKDAEIDIGKLKKRKEIFLSSDFINDFPVIIIAGVGYFNTNKNTPDDLNEIEKTFNVKFHEKMLAGEKARQPYWIHWNEDKSRLLINTYQLSMLVTDVLFDEISDLIKTSGLIHLKEN